MDNAHNIYLGYLAGIGATGLIAFLLTALSAFLNVRNSHCAPALVGAAAAYLMHGFFGLGLSLISPVFWLFLGLCAANDNIISSEE